MFNNWTSTDLAQEIVTPSWMLWLASRDSLTKKLERYAASDIKVNVLSQGWSTPHLDECSILELTPDATVLVREVILCAHGDPLVHARTVIPQTAYAGSFSFVAEIGSQPLGQWLFTQPGVERGDIEIKQCKDFWVQEAPFEWGRRSTFLYEKSKILITEYFVEDFLNAYPSKI